MTKALYSKDGEKWQDGTPVDWTRDDEVSKVVIGTPPQRSGGDAEPISLPQPVPVDLAGIYPNLTHLYLWQIENMEVLSSLPNRLQRVDVRGCPNLRAVTNLPPNLETLVLENCPELVLDPDVIPGSFGTLTELSVAGCTSIPQAWIRDTVATAQSIRHIDLSACPQLERMTSWPASLVDIRLNQCPGLRLLPAWPPQLKRLGLRGTNGLPSLSDFPETVDYMDLAWTRALKAMPGSRGNPRTLFLYGSGVLEPPASEHGQDETENVAQDVCDYFDDVRLTGRGTVRRCKLLILGNGTAGKTCLAMNLADEDYRQAKEAAEAAGRSISTHGVQFRDRHSFKANVAGEFKDVHLHLWDFGGQEIYHNTHRLFMSKGAVFVVVWNPDQDGQQPPINPAGFLDEWRSLQYWLDLIRRSCDHMPRIAIVCSCHSKPTPELERQWKSAVRPEYHELCKCFYVDSLEKTGQKSTLLDWLADEAGLVIATQGTAVPKYWEIAQQMVESWVVRMSHDAAFDRDFRSLSSEQFCDHLQQHIDAEIDRLPEYYPKLGSALKAQEFELTPNRIRRTLNFLTRSGWVYWDAELFQGRVIVGQQWALDGLYTVLERRIGTTVFRNLCSSAGRFTQSDLKKWVWGEQFSGDEQNLLISFMVRCGLCFRIHESEHSWRGEDVYVSFEHLPTSRELGLQRQFDVSLPDLNLSEDTLRLNFLHKYDWQLFLIDAGTQYGPDAAYAEDGILFRTTKNQVVLVTCEIDRKKGFGGSLVVQVAGEDAADLLQELVSELQKRFPDGHVPGRKRSEPPQAVTKPMARPSVFISYAWNSADEPGIDYEAPVDMIEALLISHNFEIEVSRSDDGALRDSTQPGTILRD